MSNTPTESEFDKELDRALTNHRIWVYGVLSECNDKTLTQEEFVRENARYQAQAIKAIKQAVDKHVICEDIEFEYIPYTEIHSDYSETIRRIADFAGVMACSVCKTIENVPDGHVCEIENRRKQQQRKALYGRDKK
ncbi:hypothetical protein [Rhodococcus erythropolis]|uniref:hypothetical protein n=1 Tax=Rhodococcus erythropolis TaxID=1833 RepID=UPI0011D0CAA2|nr:hypothetical protein [Rhodococcus erythropolis]